MSALLSDSAVAAPPVAPAAPLAGTSRPFAGIRRYGARLLRFWAIAALFATALTLFTALQTFLQFLQRGQATSYWMQLRWSAVVWYLWALLAPFVVLATLCYPLERGRGLLRAIAFTTLFALGFIALHAVLAGFAMHVLNFDWAMDVHTAIVMLLAAQAHWGFLLYLALVATVHVAIYFRRAQDEALAREEMRTQAVAAQLVALGRQMQPHFLFNALNALVAMQPEGSPAQTFTIRLADMLRILLHGGDRATATLGDELALVESYLAIERARLGSRLRTQIDVAPELRPLRLPSFILQPLVENAITHSIARSAQGGEIRLDARRDGGNVVIEVSNSCDPQADAHPADGTQLTIPNSRRRLALMYGAAARLEAGFQTRNLFRASIILPGEPGAVLQPA